MVAVPARVLSWPAAESSLDGKSLYFTYRHARRDFDCNLSKLYSARICDEAL